MIKRIIEIDEDGNMFYRGWKLKNEYNGCQRDGENVQWKGYDENNMGRLFTDEYTLLNDCLDEIDVLIEEEEKGNSIGRMTDKDFDILIIE